MLMFGLCIAVVAGLSFAVWRGRQITTRDIPTGTESQMQPQFASSNSSTQSVSPALDRDPQEPKIDPAADRILVRLTEALASAAHVGVRLTVDMRAMEGERTQATQQTYQLESDHGNRFRIEPRGSAEPSAMRTFSLIGDGEQLVVVDRAQHHFARFPQPKPASGQLSETARLVRYMMFLDGEVVVTPLLSPNFRDAVLEHSLDLAFVGRENLNGKTCDRIRCAGRWTQWDGWFDTDSGSPVQVRFDLSEMDAASRRAGKEEGRRELTLTFDDWTLDREPGGVFTWNPTPEYTEQPDMFSMPAHASVDSAVPAVELASLDGVSHDLAVESRGRVLVIDFWASWCAPCLRGIVELEQLADSYRDQKVSFYAVNRGDERDAVAAIVEARNIRLPVLLDPNDSAGKVFQVKGMPHTVIVGGDGQIAAVYRGLSPGLHDEMSATIRRLIEDIEGKE
jgi:thiol-disulfide isomerase/thioredoxin